MNDVEHLAGAVEIADRSGQDKDAMIGRGRRRTETGPVVQRPGIVSKWHSQGLGKRDAALRDVRLPVRNRRTVKPISGRPTVLSVPRRHL